ncbi:MAG: hypothetical protein KAT77_03405 [Nanoarchaeota archaeon]|nr:hypothetical protein [Nanoarchaeota archaeon]
MKSKITPELAEMAGIHAGDGYLRYEGKRKELDISGSVEEKEYYDNHVIPLFNKTFNLNLQGKFFPTRNTYGFVIRNKNVLDVFKNLGFPSGKKSTIVRCPLVIKSNKNSKILRSFVRGYFDTDGSLTFDKKIHNSHPFQKTRNYYPRLMFTCVSKNLTLDFIEIIKKLGFKVAYCTSQPLKKTENLRHQTQLSGLNNLNKWIKEIGIKNQTKYVRYLIWKKFGFCPPNTTYKQRINILKSNLCPYAFYKGL